MRAANYRPLGCKYQFSALPLLTYFYVRCATVLENRYFRHKVRQLTTRLVLKNSFSGRVL